MDTTFGDTQDSDSETLGDTIHDTMNITSAAQLKEDDKFHEMTRYVFIQFKRFSVLLMFRYQMFEYCFFFGDTLPNDVCSGLYRVNV